MRRSPPKYTLAEALRLRRREVELTEQLRWEMLKAAQALASGPR